MLVYINALTLSLFVHLACLSGPVSRICSAQREETSLAVCNSMANKTAYKTNWGCAVTSGLSAGFNEIVWLVIVE